MISNQGGKFKASLNLFDIFFVLTSKSANPSDWSLHLVPHCCVSVITFFFLKKKYLILFCLLFRPATATAMQRAFDSSAPTSSSSSKSSALHSRLHPTTYPRLVSLSHPFICYFLYFFSILSLSLSLCCYYIYTHVYIFINVCVCVCIPVYSYLIWKTEDSRLVSLLVLPSILFFFFSLFVAPSISFTLWLWPQVFFVSRKTCKKRRGLKNIRENWRTQYHLMFFFLFDPTLFVAHSYWNLLLVLCFFSVHDKSENGCEQRSTRLESRRALPSTTYRQL